MEYYSVRKTRCNLAGETQYACRAFSKSKHPDAKLVN